MPCRDYDDEVRVVYRDGTDPSDRERANRLEKDLAKAQNKLDMLTDLLCKAGRARYRKTDIPPEVLSWWIKHCEIDARRGEPW